MGELVRSNENTDSISLRKTSRGWSWDLKLYYTYDTDEDLDNALSKLKNVNTKLKEEYGENNDG